MAGRLEGKVAFITGAGGGIGYAIAEKMAEEGASVVVAEIDADKGAQAKRALCDRGFSARFIRTDITDEEQVKQAVEATVTQFGSLTTLVNNAGKNFYFDATQMTSRDWDDALGVDVKGAWLCCKYAIPSMVEQGGGTIVNIASVHSTLTKAGMFPYAAAKAALIGLTRSLALDWGKKNVRVLAVSPGWVRTSLMEEALRAAPNPAEAEAKVLATQPIGRVGTPREIANLVAFLASDEASYLTGTEIVIDGGLSARFAE